MSASLLVESYEAIERARSDIELRVAMERFAWCLGFDKFAYSLCLNLPQLHCRRLMLNGYPQRWVDRYKERGYAKVDPLMEHAVCSTLPANWQDQRFHADQTHEFWEEACSFGLNTGLCFSVHGQPGVTGVFSLARDQNIDMKGRHLATLMGTAQMFASLLQHAVCRITLPKLLPASARGEAAEFAPRSPLP